jgi:hypothetical protein
MQAVEKALSRADGIGVKLKSPKQQIIFESEETL